MSKETLERGMFKGTGEVPTPGVVYKWCSYCYFCSGLSFTITPEYHVEYLANDKGDYITLCYHYEGIKGH